MRTRHACGALLAAALLLASPRARAQLHWDAAAGVGAMRRVLTSKPPGGGGDAGLGPVGELHGHIALLPLLRIGAYLGHDISPMPGDVSALQITSFGARAKLTAPWPLDPWRVWAFAGFGYAAVYGPSYHTHAPGTQADALVVGAGGGFFEVPFGLGISYKVRRPLHLMAELSGRAGFGFRGSVFDDATGRSAFPQNEAPFFASNPGVPSLGVGLLLGIMLDL